MTAKNDITGDLIATKTTTEAYRNNYDTIFGKKNKEEKKYRRFTHKDGFIDGTSYVDVAKDGSYACAVHPDDDLNVDVSGTYTMALCLYYVENGSWIEVVSPN